MSFPSLNIVSVLCCVSCGNRHERAYPSPPGKGGRERIERPGGVNVNVEYSPHPTRARLSPPREPPSPERARDDVALASTTSIPEAAARDRSPGNCYIF